MNIFTNSCLYITYKILDFTQNNRIYKYVFTCCLDKMTNKLIVLLLALISIFVMNVFSDSSCLYVIFSVRHSGCMEIELSTIKDQRVKICE